MDYATYDAKKIQGTMLSQKDLRDTLKELMAMSQEERLKAVDLGRDDLIASSIWIYDELCNISDFSESMLVHDGIREGVVFDTCMS